MKKTTCKDCVRFIVCPYWPKLRQAFLRIIEPRIDTNKSSWKKAKELIPGICRFYKEA